MLHREVYAPPSVWVILGPVLMMGVFSLFLSFLAPKGTRPPNGKWKGLFYSNSDDPALFVPKRHGIGYTLNFGNRWSWAVVTLVFLMMALPIVLSWASIARVGRLRR